MKFKLELEFSSPENLRVIAILAALLEDCEEVTNTPDITNIDVIDAINCVCQNSWLDEEDIEEWILERDIDSAEWWRHTLRVRCGKHINDEFTPPQS